ncbi:uncharacterized protein LOC106667396 [Cimex lectularius]|uniref:Uncharacterized protein n=1 Tax=Cimex lectularius TaxID=79782 RepID=A0A8I6TI01_CIMLE|nr:uncharacterized protein LOC106667396 [Cimex lectularius]
MGNLYLLVFFTFGPCVVLTETVDTIFYSKLDNVVYNYLNDIKNEKELEVCRPDSVCNVVNQRYWLPSKVYRVCRCAKGQCPFEWKNDDQSVPLDNQSQLKTCERTNNMEICSREDVGLTVKETKDKKAGIWKKDISLKCRCDWPLYWRLSGTTMNMTHNFKEYTCSKLYKCQSGEFCAHIRADTYSAYYQCSCPKGHICITKDKTVRNVTELLYHGPSLRAYCVRYVRMENTTKPV